MPNAGREWNSGSAEASAHLCQRTSIGFRSDRDNSTSHHRAQRKPNSARHIVSTGVQIPRNPLIVELTCQKMLTRFTGSSPLRLLTSSLYLSSVRHSHHRAMSTPTLDPTIFNRTLYNKITELWFPGLDTSGQSLDMSLVKQWFMPTPSERTTFDTQCRAAFSHALSAIDPTTYPSADASPFIREIQRVASEKGDEESAWTALSLTLLLDQIPRNLYRSETTLPLVYTHYDKIAYSVILSLLDSPQQQQQQQQRVDTHPSLRLSAAHRLWFYMPLMHSENLASHDLLDEILNEYATEVQALDGYQGSKMFLDGQRKAAKEHRDILERFGRYPHRNAALGRVSTEEEEAFLSEGGATFGVGRKGEEEEGEV